MVERNDVYDRSLEDRCGALVVEAASVEGLQHAESVLGLIHGDHVAGIVDFEEREVSEVLEGTGRGVINKPIGVVLLVEFFFVGPLGSIGPCFTSAPIADPVFVARVDKHFDVTVAEHVGDIGHQVGHPVSEKVRVHHGVALYPFAS